MRAARIILVVVVILGGLFVAADRIALSVAQNKAAERAQATEDLTDRPKVSIKGFPFLTQAVSRDLGHVSISADGISAESAGRSVEVEDFHADLYDVKLSNGYSEAKADRATGTAKISYADLSKAAPENVSISYPGGGATDTVKITGSYNGAHLSVLSKVSVEKPTGDSAANTLALRAESLPKVFTALGIEDDVRDKIDFTPQLSHLPANLGLTKVVTGPDGITIEFGGHGVVLAG